MVGYVKFLLFTYYQLWGFIIIYLGDAMEIDGMETSRNQAEVFHWHEI